MQNDAFTFSLSCVYLIPLSLYESEKLQETNYADEKERNRVDVLQEKIAIINEETCKS